MITVEEAKKILLENVNELNGSLNIKTIESLGSILSENICSPLDLPPFDQSNVDGYAVKFSNKENTSWNVIAEIKAGDNYTQCLKEGEAVRIFTGAMVPENADCVIMQEKIKRNEDLISYDDEIKPAEHIRRKGSQIKKGELALEKGTVINPSVIGFISSMGLKEVKVFRKPKITLVITGSELQEPGSILEFGKVYESNSYTLIAALATMNLNPEHVYFVKDDKEKLAETINIALKETDVLLISGGVSVGDYDYVNEVLKEKNTTTLFYKIAQKPGKPLFFGKNKEIFIFGLPGNPASALTCFYEYVYPCIRKLSGRKDLFLKTVKLPLEKEIIKKKGLANFLKATANINSVLALDGQESYKIKSFTEANAFIYLSSENENMNIGDIVEVHLLPEL